MIGVYRNLEMIMALSFKKILAPAMRLTFHNAFLTVKQLIKVNFTGKYDEAIV